MSYPKQLPAANYPPAGQYPPPGQPGQYPPTGQPEQYPPTGQYPPPGQPGQYPPAGQYPPPGQPGQYPPGPYPPVGQPGPYPPVGQPGQYPPPGQPGHYPSQGGYPPMAPGGQPGFDSVDSDPEDYLRSKDESQPVTVKFVNKTTFKVKLYWLDFKGDLKKPCKIKEGRVEKVDSYEGHKYMAFGYYGKLVINGNELFIVRTGHGSHGKVQAEITNGKSKNWSYCFQVVFRI
uniref:von Hippel-Lindau disease tumour suppressor beta domain-containing protein n=1 Tax=Clytia hemisphaerica TaxID=252671 RepID=A0A7M5XJJ7_9CNID